LATPTDAPWEVISVPSGNGDARPQSTERLLLGIDHIAIAVSDSEALLRF
jgi:hypothetical protein